MRFTYGGEFTNLNRYDLQFLLNLRFIGLDAHCCIAKLPYQQNSIPLKWVFGILDRTDL